MLLGPPNIFTENTELGLHRIVYPNGKRGESYVYRAANEVHLIERDIYLLINVTKKSFMKNSN